MAISSELKVGALFFAGLGLAIWFTFKTQKSSNGAGDYKVQFHRVARLAPGDPVLYNGVRIGKVAGVTAVLKNNNEPSVQVAFSVEDITKDAVLVGPQTVVRINQGLLGGASMEIVSTGGSAITPEALNQVISSDPASFDEVMRSLQDILDDNRTNVREMITAAKGSLDKLGSAAAEIQVAVSENRTNLKAAIANTERLTGVFKDVVSENRETLRAAIANAERMTGEIAGMVSENREIVKSALHRIDEASKQIADLVAENRKNIADTTGKLPQAVDNFTQAAGEIRDAMAENRADLRAAMAGVASFAPKLDRIGTNVEKITGHIAAGQGTVGKLVFEDTLHDQASGMMTSVQERLGEIKPFTQGLSELRLYAGLEAGGNASTGTTRTAAYLRVEPRPWKFYEGGLSYRTAPTDRVTSKDDPDKLGVDFNLLLGWRFQPNNDIQRYRTTIAGGLIDSNPAIYGEWALTHDLDLRIMARMKDNRRDRDDRRYEHGDAMVRATFTYRLWDRVYVLVGVDDIASSDAGVWVGLRAELLDNDLRNLTSAASLGK